MSELIVAVDAGTTSMKASVIDSGFRVVATAEEPTCVRSPRPGHREIDMRELGESMFRVLGNVIAQVEPRRIIGLALTGQGDGAWLLDENAEPVGPAILWNDARSADDFVAMRDAGEIERIKRSSRGSVHPGSLPVIARHLSREDPGLLSRVRYQLNCKDWIRYLLTDVLETEASDACRSYLDTSDGTWHAEIFGDLGDLPQSTTVPLSAADATRPLSDRAARRLGLPAGLPIGVGAMDVAAVGYAFCGDEPERAWAIVGTTSFVGVVREEVVADQGNWMSYGSPGLFVNSLAPMIGTPLLEWARHFLGCDGLSWEEFERFAAEGGSTTGGRPLTLPYLAPSGERAPFVEPFARGSIHGMTYDSTTADVAWSVYTGIALTIAECIGVLRVDGAISVAGGGGASDLLCQLIADYSGVAVERPVLSAEAGMIGAVRRLRASIGLDSPHLNAHGAFTRFEPSLGEGARLSALDTLRRVRDAEASTWKLLAQQR